MIALYIWAGMIILAALCAVHDIGMGDKPVPFRTHKQRGWTSLIFGVVVEATLFYFVMQEINP
jgi:hypothetical protein